MTFNFTLLYKLGPQEADHDALVERMFSAGCGDALVGLGRPGHMALDFTRDGATASDAVASARARVRQAAPTAQFLQVERAFSGDSDITDVVRMSC